MAMKRRTTEEQASLWIAHNKLARSPGHPSYEALNQILDAHRFDRFAEELCEPFYKECWRPSIMPGTYFRMLFVGYFEGIESERGIDWRCSDSLSLRKFLCLGDHEASPDHSSLNGVREGGGVAGVGQELKIIQDFYDLML